MYLKNKHTENQTFEYSHPHDSFLRDVHLSERAAILTSCSNKCFRDSSFLIPWVQPDNKTYNFLLQTQLLLTTSPPDTTQSQAPGWHPEYCLPAPLPALFPTFTIILHMSQIIRCSILSSGLQLILNKIQSPYRDLQGTVWSGPCRLLQCRFPPFSLTHTAWATLAVLPSQEYPKHDPASGPLYVLFSLPRILFPLDRLMVCVLTLSSIFPYHPV